MSVTRRDILLHLGTSIVAWIVGGKKAFAQPFPRIDFPVEPVDPRFPPRDPHLFLIKGLGFICIEPSFIPTRLRFSISRSFEFPLNVRVETSSPAFVISSGNTFTIPARETVFEISLATLGLERGGRSVRSGNLRILVSSDRLTVEKRVDVFVKTRGEWFSGGELDLVGVHAALLSNGQVLLFGYDSDNLDIFVQPHRGKFQLWDSSPEQRRPIGTATPLRFNPFCSGHAFLGDGRLLVAGGHTIAFFGTGTGSAKKVFTVSPSSTGVTWNEHPEMANSRWYPTCVTMANGEVFIIGGSSPGAYSDWEGTNDNREYFDPRRNLVVRDRDSMEKYPTDERWDRPSSDSRRRENDGSYMAGLYPLSHLLPSNDDDAPNGLLFVLTEVFARIYNPTTNEFIGRKILIQEGFRTWPTQGSSVLLPITISPDGLEPPTVKLLIVGGGLSGNNDSSVSSVNTADIFSYSVRRRRLTLERTIRLNRPRFMGDSILLPDGNVLLIGGASTGYANENSNPIFTPELITPSGPTSSRLVQDLVANPMRTIRGYHASSLLLPDASILISGGTCGWISGVNSGPKCEEKSVEIFEPPYFSCGPRPIIMSAPDRLSYGESFEVESQSSDVREQIILIRFGSRTHSLDTDQRMLRLQARRRSDVPWILQAKMPTNRTYAPPGPYMMFLLRGDEHGVPSLAKIVQIS